jgi:acyl-CoA reductase-like NAD-dependent aldehyde dehydrogenase
MEISSTLEFPFIDGSADTSRADHTFRVVNPATEQVVAEVVEGDQSHVDDAVRSAAEGQKAWVALPTAKRSEALWAWANLIETRGEECVRLDTVNMGRPLRDGLAEIAGIAARARYWAGMIDKISGRQIPTVRGHLSYTVREPLGVVAVIVPWNGPSSNFVGRSALSLACGNAVVVKPSELSPQSGLRLAELAVMAGIPHGVINVLPGGAQTGSALAAHAGVGGIAFTGSVAAGRAVAHAAADTFKSVSLELGGKSPNIVFADSDLDAAARGTVWGVFANSGQVCCGGTRLLVEASVADEFVDRIVRLTAAMRIGDPLVPANHIGPVASARQHERVLEYLRLGSDEGAVLAIGGGRPDGVGADGYYVAPTIFSSVDPGMRIAREEIFGPVLSVIAFSDEEEALSVANGVEFGLSASVWTSDVGRMLRMSERLESATVWGNTMRLFHPSLPFGGFKSSGIGNTAGVDAIEGQTKLKRVSIRFDPQAAAPGWDDLG